MADNKYSLLINRTSQGYYTFDQCVSYYNDNFRRDVFDIFWFPGNSKTISTNYGWTHTDILFTQFLGSKLFHTVFEPRRHVLTPALTPAPTLWWIALFSWHRSMIQLLSDNSPFCDRFQVRKQIIIFLDELAPNNFFASEFFTFAKQRQQSLESRMKSLEYTQLTTTNCYLCQDG
jgi:hypothetical protein